MRQILAFFLAPVPTVILMALFNYQRVILSGVMGFLGALWILQLVFGVFIRIELRRRGKMSIGWHALGGALMFAIPGIPLLLLPPHGQLGPTAWVFVILIVLAMGALTGVTYALVAGRQVPRADALDDLTARFD